MLKAGVANGSMTFSLYEYVADDADILEVYETLGIDPYYRIKCYKCDLLGDGYHLYRVLEHMNDYHRASFNEIGSYRNTRALKATTVFLIPTMNQSLHLPHSLLVGSHFPLLP